MSRSIVIASGVATVAALGAGIAWLGAHDGKPSGEEQWPLFGQYCIDCHNRDDLTADIAFDRMSAESIAHEPEIFEAVVRPQGEPNGDADAEIERLRKEVARAEGMLDNERFVSSAPAEVVEGEREKLARYRRELDALGG